MSELLREEKFERVSLDFSNQNYYEPNLILELSDSIEKIDLCNNYLIDGFPTEILQCSNLVELNLSCTSIKQIPDEIHKLENLEILYLAFCQLNIFPESILSCKKIKILHLNGNNIDEVPSSISNLLEIEELFIGNNPFVNIPSSLFDLSGLMTLDMSSCQIENIPQNLGKLKCVSSLGLCNNVIREVSPQIGLLKGLESIDLSRNRISALPEAIGGLYKLKDLVATSNLIENIPVEISHVEGVEYLCFKNNPIDNVPEEILRRGTGAIISFLRSISSDGVDKIHEAKIVFVGQGEVGKTSLKKKLIDNGSKLDLNERTTEGIDVDSWYMYIESKDRMINFRANLWDFGGQEIYYATHQYFLTNRSLYVLVWTARKDESIESFDYWLNVISLLSKNSPIIIVLNKIDKRLRDVDQLSIKNKFNNVIGFYQTSCMTGDGVFTLKKAVESALIQLPHIGDRWPSNWSRVRAILETSGKDHISLQDYLDICNELGIEGHDAINLAQYLHDLGVLLYYRDDPYLKNIIILNPKWATKAAYVALDSKEILRSKGHFEFDYISKIWLEMGYPLDTHAYLLQLMIRYELCYKSDKDTEFLIPSLFPESSPDIHIDYSECFTYRYQYEFMPAGIMTRFIARNSEHIKDKLCWKNGVMISYNGVDSLIECDRISRRITVKIFSSDYMDVLGLIRADFARINRSLNNPVVVEEIPCPCKDPFMFNYDFVRNIQRKGEDRILCYKCGDKVSISEMLCLDQPDKEKESNVVNNYFEGGFMEIKEFKNNGNAIVGDNVTNCSINTVASSLKSIVDDLNVSYADKKSLYDDISIVDSDADINKKMESKNRIEAFLHRNSDSIGSGLITSLIMELGKLVFY
ncbi:GTP-binding protein [Motiliproteus coralliicola]|uniref:non-specific serine/threonine protein kinase n=1 Tax=Motiliproteus coralliicola TaxID=2283196 RepID=A0A369WV08_9GAMM|nr:COR domain-containing protein [Motiliproteus coralliicola]RDE24963.1 GTP-binding protein [Motiliproteus coralliicola]